MAQPKTQQGSWARRGTPEEWNDSNAVDEFLSKLDQPLKPVFAAIRSAILSAAPHITEGIKWNAPSFYSNDGLR